ncbi:DUF2510 domain-containing protein [Mycobacteroides abscessus]
MTTQEADWYPDPTGLPQWRWFDSQQWTTHTAPMPPAPSSPVQQVIVLLAAPRSFIARHPFLVGIAAFFVLGIFPGIFPILWWAFLALVAYKVAKFIARKANAYNASQQAIAARADLQNAQVLNGDIRGIYGQYPPPDANQRAAA